MLDLWWKVKVCQAFPAYRLCDVEDTGDMVDLLKAMRLLSLERDVRAANGG